MAASGSHAPERRVWGNAQDSDVTVILHSGGAEFMQAGEIPCMSFAPPSTSCTSCNRPSAVGTGTRLPYDSILQLHSDQLCASSGYFSTALSTGLSIFCRECRAMHLVMKGRLLEAAHHVLRFMYTNEVTLGDGFVADGMLYLWMIKVADCWVVPSCITACQTALARREASHFPSISILLLPSTFCSEFALAPAIAQATSNIKHLFPDALQILLSTLQRDSFLKLPHSVMLIVLHNDLLHTDSEATVLLLAHAWVESNQSTMTPQVLEAVKGAVRYAYLDQAYLRTALPHLPGFTLTAAEHVELRKMHKLRQLAPGGDWTGPPVVCPASWFVGRQFLPRCDQSTAFSLHLGITHEKLQAHVTAVSAMAAGGPAAERIQSDTMIAHGYEWRAVFSSDTLETAFTVEMQVCLPSRQDTIVNVRCNITLTLHRQAGHVHLQDSKQYHFTSSTALASFECGGEALGGDPDLRHWAHWLDTPRASPAKGNLCIEAYVQMAARDYGAY